MKSIQMTSIQKKLTVFLAVLFLVGVGMVGTSEASTVISVTPSSQTIAPGDVASVDITVSGVTQAIGAFSFLLSFNDSILGAPATFTPDPDGAMGAGLDFSFGFTGAGGSPLDLYFLAEYQGTLSEADLLAMEAPGFVLARVTWTGLNQGLSPLTLSVHPSTGVYLSDYDGLLEVPATAVNGSVCVADPLSRTNPCATTPEASTLSLMVAGLATLAFVTRKRQARAEV